ncbi:hypothetical protein Pan1_100 [Pseudanabaena phage Pan1]|nr:hypothetical protein Pan1_100 [Pseudanabaena phage Pan1]
MGEIDVTKQVTLSLTVSLRQALIQSLVDMIPKQFIEAVVIGLLRRDATTRCVLAEELGEQALSEHEADTKAQQIYDANKGNGCEPPTEKSWDQIMIEVLDRMADTPGGRGEVD